MSLRARVAVRAALAGVVATVGVWAKCRSPESAAGPDVAAADAACRESDFASFERDSDGEETVLHVSADRNPVRAGVEVDASMLSGITWVTLRDTASERRVEATFEVAFDRILQTHPVPDEIAGADGASWRRMLEDAAFERVCTRMDPSLERLLSPEEQLLWHAGEPAMPTSYAIFHEMPVAGDSYWIEYLGANHRRLTTDTLSDRLEVVDRRGDLELLRSGHGAVVRDLVRNRYAWLYVYGGGRKLRWPSVIGGRFDGDAVLLDLDTPVLGEGTRQIRIDLSSGAIRPAS